MLLLSLMIRITLFLFIWFKKALKCWLLTSIFYLLALDHIFVYDTLWHLHIEEVLAQPLLLIIFNFTLMTVFFLNITCAPRHTVFHTHAHTHHLIICFHLQYSVYSIHKYTEFSFEQMYSSPASLALSWTQRQLYNGLIPDSISIYSNILYYYWLEK